MLAPRRARWIESGVQLSLLVAACQHARILAPWPTFHVTGPQVISAGCRKQLQLHQSTLMEPIKSDWLDGMAAPTSSCAALNLLHRAGPFPLLALLSCKAYLK